MDWRNKNLAAVLTLLGGLALLFATLLYLRGLLVSYGFVTGTEVVVSTYNLTLTSQLASILPSLSALSLALYIAYLMVPLSLMVFAIGVAWLFTGRQDRWLAVVAMVSALFYLGLAAMLELNFNFGYSTSNYYSSYLGVALSLIGGVLVVVHGRQQSRSSRSAAASIAINPDTPYTNISILSNRVMGRMSGALRILDMHFDLNGLDNLMRMMSGKEGRYTSLRILTRADRLTPHFDRSYLDFKRELQKKGVEFELRVLPPEIAAEQHERMIMDSERAFKIPPLNIINRKSEHIVGMNHADADRRFEKIWSSSTKYENLKG